MRLGFIRQRYTPFGGQERLIERAAAALVARGVGVSVYARAWPRGVPAGVEPVICNPWYAGSLWRDAGFARAVRQALVRDRPDVVQTHERIAGCDVFHAGDGLHRVWLDERVRAGGQRERLRIAANPHHRYVLDAEARVFGDPSLKAVFSMSQMVRDEILAHFPIDARKLHVIYDAIDPAAFGPHVRAGRDAARARCGLEPDAVAFLLVGSGYWRKGVPAAIRALARLPRQARLVVVGRDKEPARYAALARRAGVADRVVFAGPQSDPRPYYGAADAFVLPSIYDPLSIAVLEALACGLPVVTSRRCGAGEIVVAHEAGWTCDALDDAALARHMEHLLDAPTRAELSERAVRAVAALTPAALTERLLDLYSTVAGAPAGDTRSPCAASPAT